MSLAILTAACGPLPTTQPTLIGSISIGADLPLSGDDAPDGLPVRDAIELAIKQAGRLCGASAHREACLSLTLNALDDVNQGVHDPATGAKNIRLLTADDRVVGVVGPLYDSVARSEIPIANAVGLPIISPANTDECLTQEPPDGHCGGLAGRLRTPGPTTYFRVVSTQLAEGLAAADLSFRTLGKRRAFIADDRSLIGQALRREFVERFSHDGGKVVDAPALAEVVFFAGSDLQAAAALRRDLAGRQPAIPMVGSHYLANNQFAKAVGALAPGSYFTVAGVYPPRVQNAGAFRTAYRKTYGHDPNGLSLQAFDATNLLFAAVERAIDDAGGNRPSRKQVLAALSGTSNYPALMGSLGFDRNGDTTLKLVTAFQWTASTAINGEFVSQLNVG